MNILMLSFNQRGKGTWLRAFNLASELVKLGNQVALLCSDWSNSRKDTLIEHVNGITEVNFHSTIPGKYLHGWDLCEVIHRSNWLKGRAFDIVHVFENRPTNQVPAIWAKRNGALLISDWADWLGKGGSVEERRNPLLRGLLSYPETLLEESGRKKAIGCTVINSTLYKKAKNLGFSEDKLLLLSNGYFNSRLISIPVQQARLVLGLSEKDFLIGYLGTSFFSDSEIMQDAINAASERSDKLKFIQIGQNKFSPRNSINIINTGQVSEEKLSLFLSACNVFWLPLANSGANLGRSPYKFGDYLTIGRPIISTDVGDQAELIRKEKLGLTTECSGKRLFEAIEFLRSDPSSCDQYGTNAYKFARQDENSWEQKGKLLMQFYNKF
jgi:glycosyltransferase involved in cell wall biosynthesis